MNKYSTNRIVDFQGNGFQLPLELLKQSLDIKQKKFDANYEMSKKLQDIAVPALPQDIPFVRAKQADYQRKVMELVKQSDGDYSLLSKQFLDLAYEAKKDLSPVGDLGQVAGFYNHYKTWTDYHQQKADKVNKNVVNKYIAAKMADYKGVAAGDRLQLENIPDHIDIPKRLTDELKDIHIDETGDTRIYRDKAGRIITEESKSKSRSFEKLLEIATYSLRNDPTVAYQYKLYGDVLGIDPDKALEIDAAIGASRFAVNKEDNTLINKKWDTDPYSLESYKAKLKYKYDKQLLDGERAKQLIGEVNLGIKAPEDQNSMGSWLAGGAANLFGIAGQASGFGNFQTQKDQAYNYLVDKKYGKFDNTENAIKTITNHIGSFAHGTDDAEQTMQGFRDYVAKTTGKRLEETHSPNVQRLYKTYFDNQLASTVNRRAVYGIPFTEEDKNFLERAANNTPSLMYRNIKTGETKSGYDLGLSSPLGDKAKDYKIRSTGYGTDYGAGIVSVDDQMFEMVNDTYDPYTEQHINATTPLRSTNPQTYGKIKLGMSKTGEPVYGATALDRNGQLQVYTDGWNRLPEGPKILNAIQKESIKANFGNLNNSWKFNSKGQEIDE